MISIKKTLRALTKRHNKILWTGSWNSGTITVPNTNKYKVFLIQMNDLNTVTVAVRYGQYIRGVGGCQAESTAGHFTAFFGATWSENSENTWTWVGCASLINKTNDNHTVLTNRTVTQIIGLV